MANLRQYRLPVGFHLVDQRVERGDLVRLSRGCAPTARSWIVVIRVREQGRGLCIPIACTVVAIALHVSSPRKCKGSKRLR